MAKQKVQEPEKPEYFRLAEILTQKRVESTVGKGVSVIYFECQLCHGKSESVFTEIAHMSYCPLNRL